jgi:hypothetical protein
MPKAITGSAVIKKGESITVSIRFGGWERGDLVGPAYIHGIPAFMEKDIVYSNNQRIIKFGPDFGRNYTYACDMQGGNPIFPFVVLQIWVMWSE